MNRNISQQDIYLVTHVNVKGIVHFKENKHKLMYLFIGLLVFDLKNQLERTCCFCLFLILFA